jgi:hypothetical protein
LTPLGDALVAGDDHGATFVSAGDDLEDHVGFGPIQRQVADLVDTNTSLLWLGKWSA